MKINDYEYVLNILKKSYDNNITPSVTLISQTKKEPFFVLLSTIISLRTKDETTLKVSGKLFDQVKNLDDIHKISEKNLSVLLFPAGFYKTKAKRIKDMVMIIRNKFNDRIPDTMEDLLSLPGVGRKTANLVLSLGFNKPGLCVDTHVHRITNRLGWVNTKTPEKTEFKLRELLKEDLWGKVNNYLVSYGQLICKPISPICTKCELDSICPKIGVKKTR